MSTGRFTADCAACGRSSDACMNDFLRDQVYCCTACLSTSGCTHEHMSPAKPSGSHSPGPAASETPQDAREVERPQSDRARILAKYGEEADRVLRECDERGLLGECTDPQHADTEEWLHQASRATWEAATAYVKTVEAQRDALQRDLAQAVSERDRLRAERKIRLRRIDDALRRASGLLEAVRNECKPIDGLCHEHDLTDDGECALVADLTAICRALDLAGQNIAAPDADAQDERPSMTDAASVGLGSHESAWVNDPTPADWDDAQDKGVLP